MMTYKETLFFIGKCLTITHEEKSRIEVEFAIKNHKIDWDTIVKVSTAQYVFPALYFNLKYTDLLHYIPEELVNYMKHITDLNRERNQQIIEQAKEINTLLLKNNIIPVFLKGTGFLVENLYEDIAERMLGDIDFLVNPKDYLKTISILKSNDYTEIESTVIGSHRHYNRIVHKNHIAAVEIHKEMVTKKHIENFNYNTIKNDILKIDEFSLLSFSNQTILTILAKQINDKGMYYKTVSLRGFYDIFLLSKKVDLLTSIKRIPSLFSHLNSYLALTSVLLNNPTSVVFEDNTFSKSYIKTALKIIENPDYRKLHFRFYKNYFFIKKRLSIFLKATYKKQYRDFIFDRMFHRNKIRSNS